MVDFSIVKCEFSGFFSPPEKFLKFHPETESRPENPSTHKGRLGVGDMLPGPGGGRAANPMTPKWFDAGTS